GRSTVEQSTERGSSSSDGISRCRSGDGQPHGELAAFERRQTRIERGRRVSGQRLNAHCNGKRQRTGSIEQPEGGAGGLIFDREMRGNHDRGRRLCGKRRGRENWKTQNRERKQRREAPAPRHSTSSIGDTSHAGPNSMPVRSTSRSRSRKPRSRK